MSLVRPEEGERLRAAAGEYIVRLPGEQTKGALAIVEYLLPGGALGAAPHIHHGHVETFQVLEGEITFDFGGGEETSLGAGGTLMVPRGQAHGFRNASGDAARCLFILTPAGYENYFRDIHRALERGETLTAERLAELRAEYDTVSA
ncbi:cupin domain-containing protein [Spirillospora sp. CA-294931]|uniref:cupin domain-containing protein n=1 Tax=Spirillospora sp. CA-294931 TaxID=3240042 RepID=UPI003D8EDF7C